MSRISEEELKKRNTVGINLETVTSVTSTDFPGHYPGEKHEWDIIHFKNGLEIEFHKNEPYDAVFSLKGIDSSIANAFRRILLAEIPTLAIETVFIENNTSIIQDEVLAHRLGQIPLKGNKAGLRWLQWRHKPTEDDPVGDPITDFNTVKLKLHVECEWAPDGKRKAKEEGETDPLILYRNAHVYASDLEFVPVGQQAENYFHPDNGAIEPVHPGILLAKLRPGQGFHMSMYAIKGIGADHAKFSPVATAAYRLMPTIDIKRPIIGADARKFARCFNRGVIGLQPITAKEARDANPSYEGQEGTIKAIIKDPIRDTVSRECLRHDEFKDKVKLGRRRDHFIFSVESTGQFDSEELFLESVKILKMKCERLKENLDELIKTGRY